jgi:glycosyltransferase involved in cell wall biosynthesis
MNSFVAKAPKVLIVGMADSIHLARWIMQYEESNFSIRLVSSSPHRRVHPDIASMIAGTHPSGIRVSMPWISRALSLPMWLMDRFLADLFRGALIRHEIRTWQPALVHALELQNAGYATARALEGITPDSRPKLLITNYGSEIVWFRQFPKHLAKLKNLVTLADAFSAECHRDVLLAKEIGFTGTVLSTIPVSGGIDFSNHTELFDAANLAPRTTIAIKGYQNVWGQALNALEAIESISDQLEGFTIELFSCNRKTLMAAKKLAKRTHLSVIAHKKHSLKHADVLAILRRSVAYIGLSKSDGISTSMIEAMSQGAIPIQSNSSCGSEWLDDGRDGFLVHFADVEAVASALSKIVSNKKFSASAQRRNFETVAKRYNKTNLSQVARGYYSQLLA